MKKAFDIIEKAMIAVMIIFFLLFTGLTCTQVITRYLLSNSITWTEQVSRYLFIWLIFLGLPILYRHYEHASFTMLQDALPEKGRESLRLILNLLVLAFAVFYAVWSIRYCMKMSNKVMVGIGFPMNYVYSAQPVGAILLGLFDIELIADNIKALTKRIGKEGQA